MTDSDSTQDGGLRNRVMILSRLTNATPYEGESLCHRKEIVFFICVALLGFVLMIIFNAVLVKRTEEARHYFSTISLGMARGEVMEILSSIPGVPQSLMLQDSEVLHISWPYTYRPSGVLQILFVDGGVASVWLVNADTMVEWPGIDEHIARFGKTKELFWLDLLAILSASMSGALLILWLKQMTRDRYTRPELILTACVLATLSAVLILGYNSRIFVLSYWIPLE